MEEPNVEVVNNNQERSGLKLPLILTIFLVLAVGIIFILNRTKDKQPSLVLPSPLSSVISSRTAESDDLKVVEVKVASYFFDPKTITVKEGEKVKLILANSGGMHDFVIDEFNVRSKTLNSGETAEITFTADKKGEYEYYCSISNHRAMGMVGKLIVE